VALNRDAMRLYPFCRLKDTANTLIMPAIHSASISTKIVSELGGATVLGPMLVGLKGSVQICSTGASVSEVLNLAIMAAYDLNRDKTF
jgi:malate dehydrogenase (oxaloacetate-decarboxylating)(NADP+)